MRVKKIRRPETEDILMSERMVSLLDRLMETIIVYKKS